jgi:hypothetical protein
MTNRLVRQFIADGFVRSKMPFRRTLAKPAPSCCGKIGADLDDVATWAEPGRWLRRSSLGSFPLRFPHPDEPDDAGWHVEGSYQPPGADGYWVNLHSKGRALLMLFLLSTVDEYDAPDPYPGRLALGYPAATAALR